MLFLLPWLILPIPRICPLSLHSPGPPISPVDHLTSLLRSPLFHPHSPFPTEQPEGSFENQTWSSPALKPPTTRAQASMALSDLARPLSPPPRLPSGSRTLWLPSPGPYIILPALSSGLCTHWSACWSPPVLALSFDYLLILPPTPAHPPEPEGTPGSG